MDCIENKEQNRRLDAAGHRTGVTELSGRAVGYGYDNLYRLTSETIASDPSGINGVVSYTYDSVGNRKQMTSTLAPIPAGLFNYDANDRFTAGDTYDANGNTTSSGGIANVYDFENHLIQGGWPRRASPILHREQSIGIHYCAILL